MTKFGLGSTSCNFDLQLRRIMWLDFFFGWMHEDAMFVPCVTIACWNDGNHDGALVVLRAIRVYFRWFAWALSRLGPTFGSRSDGGWSSTGGSVVHVALVLTTATLLVMEEVVTAVFIAVFIASCILCLVWPNFLSFLYLKTSWPLGLST